MKLVIKQQTPPPTIKKSGWRFVRKGKKYPAPREVLGKKPLIEVLKDKNSKSDEILEAIVDSANLIYAIEMTIHHDNVGLLVMLRDKQRAYVEVKSIDRKIDNLGFNVYFS